MAEESKVTAGEPTPDVLVPTGLAEARLRTGVSLVEHVRARSAEHGFLCSGERTVRYEPGFEVTEIVALLHELVRGRGVGTTVSEVVDLVVGSGADEQPAALLHLDQGVVVVRPSAVDATLVVYAVVWCDTDADGGSAAIAHSGLVEILGSIASLVADPEQAHVDVGGRRHDRQIDIASKASERYAREPVSLDRQAALDLVIESIDLTTLSGDDTAGRVRALCAQALRPDPADPSVGPVAAVCVYPARVALARQLTAGSAVAVASVAGAFPSGLSSLEVRLRDIADAANDGADEIDVVIDRAAMLSGASDVVAADLRAMRSEIGERQMKVILETSELADPDLIAIASRIAMDAGADWIKTSTGKSAAGGATPGAVYAMAQAIADYRDEVGRPVGLKVSGGVRTSADALGYLSIIESILGADWLRPQRVRFGASGLLDAVVIDRVNLHAVDRSDPVA